jgi:hypothetical protein
LASTRIRQTGEFSASTRIRQIRRRVAIAYLKPNTDPKNVSLLKITLNLFPYHVRVSQKWNVKPAASASASSCHAKLVAGLLQKFANLLKNIRNQIN